MHLQLPALERVRLRLPSVEDLKSLLTRPTLGIDVQAAFYGIIFYSLCLAFTRISILLLYRRIFTYS